MQPAVPVGRLQIAYSPTTIDPLCCPARYDGDVSGDFFDSLDFNNDGALDLFGSLYFVARLDAGG